VRKSLGRADMDIYLLRCFLACTLFSACLERIVPFILLNFKSCFIVLHYEILATRKQADLVEMVRVKGANWVSMAVLHSMP
jgi:hypothetical protein